MMLLKLRLAVLDEIGLIRINNLAGGIRNSGIKDVTYHGKLIPIRRFDENESLALGTVEFTGIGQELATICEVSTVDEFYKYIIEKMWKNFVDFSRLSAY